MTDWNKIKKEYIRGNKSMSELAQKYGVSRRQIQNHASAEGWGEDKRQHFAKLSQKVKTEGEKDAELLTDAAHKVLTYIDGLELEGISLQFLRNVTGALKDIREVLGIRHELDVEEQQARIANLRKMAEADKKDTEIVVRIEGDEGFSE